MRRIILAFQSFFGILFTGRLPAGATAALGLARRAEKPAAAAPSEAAHAEQPPDRALQLLAILQRDGRFLDFFLEDISAYSDEQIGAAVREPHDRCREALQRYFKLTPVIDGVEGTFTRVPSQDSSTVRFIGNVPARPPEGGVLRHKGWRAASVSLPPLNPRQDVSVVAPAEIEIE